MGFDEGAPDGDRTGLYMPIRCPPAVPTRAIANTAEIIPAQEKPSASEACLQKPSHGTVGCPKVYLKIQRKGHD